MCDLPIEIALTRENSFPKKISEENLIMSFFHKIWTV